jgi:hypothetical protein
MTKLADKAYIIPAEPEPESDVCIRVYVPDDPLYVAAFWGCYEYLTAWLAWERDEAHTGKIVAARWKAAFQKARDIWDCSDGSCGLMDVRQKPDAPCILQKLDDCSGEWEDFANTILCAPKMRIVGTGSIEQWNGTEWLPVDSDEGTGGSYDPGHDLSNQIAHYDPPPAGQDGQCLAAINAITYLQAAINFAMVELKELPYLVRLVDSIISTYMWRVYNFAAFTLSMVTGKIWSLTWEQAHKLMSDKSLTHEDDIIAADISDMLCTYYEAYEEDGTMNEPSFETLMGKLQDAVDAETPNTPRSLKLEWLMLMTFPGPTWMANISNNAGIDEYDCTECAGWEEANEFVGGNTCGWEATNTDERYPGQTQGVIQSNGWRNSYMTPDNYRVLNVIKESSTEFTLTSWLLTFLADMDENNPQPRTMSVSIWQNDHWALMKQKTDFSSDGTYYIYSEEQAIGTKLMIQAEGWPINEIWSQSIDLYGTGVPPTWE